MEMITDHWQSLKVFRLRRYWTQIVKCDLITLALYRPRINWRRVLHLGKLNLRAQQKTKQQGRFFNSLSQESLCENILMNNVKLYNWWNRLNAAVAHFMWRLAHKRYEPKLRFEPGSKKLEDELSATCNPNLKASIRCSVAKAHQLPMQSITRYWNSNCQIRYFMQAGLITVWIKYTYAVDWKT